MHSFSVRNSTCFLVIDVLSAEQVQRKWTTREMSPSNDIEGKIDAHLERDSRHSTPGTFLLVLHAELWSSPSFAYLCWGATARWSFGVANLYAWYPILMLLQLLARYHSISKRSGADSLRRVVHFDVFLAPKCNSSRSARWMEKWVEKNTIALYDRILGTMNWALPRPRFHPPNNFVLKVLLPFLPFQKHLLKVQCGGAVRISENGEPNFPPGDQLTSILWYSYFMGRFMNVDANFFHRQASCQVSRVRAPNLNIQIARMANMATFSSNWSRKQEFPSSGWQ